MPRKFLYTLHALVSNYSSNLVTHLLRDGAGAWSVIENITAGPTSNNLSSIACNIQGSRVLFANYPSGTVVPLGFSGSTWVPGAPVSALGGGNISAVAMSDDGKHSLASGDFTADVSPFEFDDSSGLWVAQAPVVLPSSHLNTVGMSRDGSRAMAVPKYDDAAYPLFRNPGTGTWTAGSGMPINVSSERFFSAGFSHDGDTVVVASNYASSDSDGFVWNGSGWDHVAVPFSLNSTSWRPDGLSVLGGNGAGAPGSITAINYDPVSHVFSSGQVISVPGSGIALKTALANDGIGDAGLVADFTRSQVFPLDYSRSTGLWSLGDPITSLLFSNPWNILVFPVW